MPGIRIGKTSIGFGSGVVPCTPQNVVITSITGGNRITFTSCPGTQTEIWASIDGGAYAMLVRLNIGVETYDHTGLYANIVDYKLQSYINVLTTPTLDSELITGGIRLTTTGVDTDGTSVEYYSNIEGAGYNLIATVAVTGATNTTDYLPTWIVETDVTFKARVIETEFSSSYSNETSETSPATISEGEALIRSNAVAWYKPRESTAVTATAGVESIYWDMRYGKLGALGAEQNSGTIALYAIYKITATQANFFYTGCQVGDVFPCRAVKTCDANNKVQRYTGNHLGSLTDASRPTNGVFDGVNHVLKTPAFTLIQPSFVFIVMKQITHTHADNIFDGNGNSGGTLQQLTPSPNVGQYAGGTEPVNTNLALDTKSIVRVLFNGAGGKTIVDNTAPTAGSTGTNTMGGFTLGGRGGGGGNANIQVYEVAIFPETLAAGTNETKVYNYLATANGLPTI